MEIFGGRSDQVLDGFVWVGDYNDVEEDTDMLRS